MNKFALLPLFLLLCFSAKAQDKIISLNHDTIHCTILSISNERIRYEIKNIDGSVTGKFMPLSQVAEYLCTHQLEDSGMRELKTPKPASAPEKPWCLSLNLGKSTMPWYLDNFDASSGLPDYYNKLQAGFHIDANAHYMVTGHLGLGLAYSFFKSSAGGTVQRQYASSLFLTESEKYREFINYVGGSFLFQQHLDAKRKFMFSESLSAGVLFFRLENQITYPNVTQSGYTDVSNNSLLTGQCFGAKLGLTAEYSLTDAFSVGLGGDFLWALLRRVSYESKGSNDYSYSVSNQKLSNAIKLSRIDYSFVIRYHF